MDSKNTIPTRINYNSGNLEILLRIIAFQRQKFHRIRYLKVIINHSKGLCLPTSDHVKFHL